MGVIEIARSTRRGALALFVVGVAACALPPSPSTIPGSGMPTLGVSNGTNLVVTVHHDDGCPAGDVNVRDVGTWAASC